jgi:selenide,water dikinase
MRELVLVGGGHTHVQVLSSLAMRPLADVRTTVVLDVPVAVYSGMVPGFVAGQYRPEELEIDVVPLARRAGARVVLARAVGVRPRERRVELEGRPSIGYDVASFDIGSTVAGLDLPGVREHALATRPIGRFVARFDAAVARGRESAAGRSVRVVVVGAGVGGVEIAFTLHQRLLAEGVDAEVTLLHNKARILPGSSPALVERVLRRADRDGVQIRCETAVAEAYEDAVVLEGGERLPADVLVWVTGAVAQSLFVDSGLPTEPRGFVSTRPTLQVVGLDDLFAVGDCATLVDDPATPKAGVYAVRQGPFLADNLRAVLEGGELRRYRPQSDFLALLNLGDGTAIGGKWGRAFEGAWVMRLKDRIDRAFMSRFQVLTEAGTLSDALPPMLGDETMEMACGGCAAKIGQSALDRALARVAEPGRPASADVVLGLDEADDAAAIRTRSGDIVALSVDAFSSFTDDPYVVGRAAAVNAASDLYATGVEPRHALAIVALPEQATDEDAEETLFQVLRGAGDAFSPLGVSLLGGHTTTATRLMVGFCVQGPGESDERLWRLGSLAAGSKLVLTKSLGTGVLFRADMEGLARGRWLREALAEVVLDNGPAHALARGLGVRGATDVTGFGLIGHLGEMLRSSSTSARIELDALPALPGALELLEQGVRSTFHPENERALRGVRGGDRGDEARLALLCDPQTCGGLLFAVAPDRVSDLPELLDNGSRVSVIGEVVPRFDDGALLEIV